ncbi:hypothetical protein BZG36_02418 [Bifiguratus adelaidae]|uniref:NADP-dependent oxidoreductase domain-containing protein n=1 Tax=Bifiguratus adelaidae TaxID=1938954 RepID=A0A261Y1D3_9FUNG|nr:hypothetical protein BZG36_02418 [Bifiguratus adelaidae]
MAVRLGKGVVPTAETKIVLGGKLSVPPIAIGCWAWGDKDTWGHWDAEDEAKARDAYNVSMKAGITFFDTAEVYGKGESEKCLARFASKQDAAPSEAGQKADSQAIVATKFLPLPHKLSYPSVLLNALRASLDRLQLKQVDLYQIHGPIHLRGIEVVANALADAVEAGLTKTVGVSNYSLSQTRRMHAALQKRGIQLASNQIEFSLLRRDPDVSGLIAGCHELGVAVLAYSPLAMGRLTGKYDVNNPPADQRRFGSHSMEKVQPLLDVMKAIASERSTSVSSVALNYVISKGWVLTEEELSRLEEHALTADPGLFNRFWQHG